jgi:hypothetical protein
MSLLAEFLAITEDGRSVFPQQRNPFSAPCGKRSVLWFASADAV